MSRRFPLMILWALILALGPVRVWAQAGWYATPTFSLSEQYDDNVFGTASGRRSDFITRFTPGLTAGYRSMPLTVLGSYSQDGEIFVRNPRQSGWDNRKSAGLDFRYLPERRLALGLSSSYTSTLTPAELVPETGLELGRRRASRFAVSPSVSYQLDPLTSASAGFSYERGRIRGGIGNTTEEGSFSAFHRFTPLLTAMMSYRLSVLESQGSGRVVFHVLTAGLTRQLTPTTSLTVQVGPRISRDRVSLEADARLNRRLKRGSVFLAYSRSETSVIGRAGATKVETLSGGASFSPLELVQVGVTPSVGKISGGGNGGDIMVYRVNARMSYEISPEIRARAEYGSSLQKERGSKNLLHNLFLIGLDISYPTRLD